MPCSGHGHMSHDLWRLPGIFRCAVFGGPDEALGEATVRDGALFSFQVFWCLTGGPLCSDVGRRWGPLPIAGFLLHAASCCPIHCLKKVLHPLHDDEVEEKVHRLDRNVQLPLSLWNGLFWYAEMQMLQPGNALIHWRLSKCQWQCLS